MIPTIGYAVDSATSRFKKFEFNRRNLTAHDVHVQILFCGICHSDIHQARNEWQNSTYPMVPGHEIVGKVLKVGTHVTKFKPDDIVGIGCFVDSCRECQSCKHSEEQFCDVHTAFTYNSTEMDLKTPTYGGYSTQMVIDENYALHIPPNLPLPNVAPLLCAGITTYSPLKRFKVGSGTKVGIVGMGGLGHMGVKLAVAMGADVTVISTSPNKKQDAIQLGAKHFLISTNTAEIKSAANSFDFILNTISAPHNPNLYLSLLNINGTLVLVGLPETPLTLEARFLITKNRAFAGSSIGGIKETQEMLDFCGKHNITSEIELISPQILDTAYERTLKNDVRYRFVVDLAQS